VVSGIVLVAGLVLLAAGAALFSRRSVMVDRALARTHFSKDRRPTRLADLPRALDHVFCATELQAGDHFYFAPGFVYSYRFGCGVPADLPLSTAVQASACLPAAFAARRLPVGAHQFHRDPKITEPAEVPTRALLADGGVYDNMADQWADGLADRMRRNPHLPVAAPRLDELVVVNSSASPRWTPVRTSWLPIRNELTTLQQVQAVQYAVSTSGRRHDLVARWDAAARAGAGVQGALVHIAQSPYEVPDAFAGADAAWPGRAERARKALVWLGDTAGSRAAWTELAARSRGVPTVLRKLGPDVTARLLWHAYVLAACNLHVILDDFPLPGQLPTVESFRALVDQDH
jgi:hypothetical protein